MACMKLSIGIKTINQWSVVTLRSQSRSVWKMPLYAAIMLAHGQNVHALNGDGWHAFLCAFILP